MKWIMGLEAVTFLIRLYLKVSALGSRPKSKNRFGKMNMYYEKFI